jgi:hypothetical protein
MNDQLPQQVVYSYNRLRKEEADCLVVVQDYNSIQLAGGETSEAQRPKAGVPTLIGDLPI